MADRTGIVGQVRFALANLSARNGHHEFETLCLEVARQTVTANVLPATGPVAGRGDQGRDFESFRSRVTARLGETGLLLGLDGQDVVAFACTLQRTDVVRKITLDIAAICSQGERPAAIVVYCEANVPVGDRHRIQAETRARWDISVQIIDGEGLADCLADPSLFWAAARYLAIPAELAPDEPDTSEYGDNISRWRSRQTPPASPGDFFALRGGLRSATFEPQHRGDVPFWLSRMRQLVDADLPEIARRARYEVLLATLRGLGNLRGAENAGLVDKVLSDAEADDDEAELADAGIVLGHCVAAYLAGVVDVDAATLMGWNGRLHHRIQTLLDANPSEGRRCSLLDTLGALCLLPDITDVPPPAHPSPIDIDAISAFGATGASFSAADGLTLVDSEAGVGAWLDLAGRLDTNWLYPVDVLAARLGIVAPLIRDIAGYDELTRLVDNAVGQRSGKSAVAEQCRTRALALMDSGRTRDALFELHRARVEWLSADTLRGSLLAQFFVAQCYLSLNLPHAARYFWLATAYLASRDPELTDLVPPALFGASTADYHDGAWFGALELAELALTTQSVLTDDPWDPERFDYLNGVLFDLINIDGVARRLSASGLAAASRVIDRFGLRGLLTEAIPANPWWEKLTVEGLCGHVARELGRPVFSDAGTARVIAWRALGLDWRLSVLNEYRHVLAAERLAAILQVASAELSRDELLIAPTQIRIEVRLRTADEAPTRPVFKPSNDGREWNVRLIAPEDAGDGQAAFTEAFIILFDVLGDVSLLAADDLDRLARRALHEGLLGRFAPMLFYDRIVPISEERFQESNRSAAVAAEPTDVVPFEHRDLRFAATPGPGYNRAEGERLARTRYDEFRRLLPHSLAGLMREPRVQAICQELRAEGWKDWHLLQALVNIIWNFRIARQAPADFEAAEALGREISRTPEGPNAPIPPVDSIDGRAMRTALRMSMAATLRGWGLNLRQRTPDLPAIERLLGARYAYWEDDVPHDRWWEADAN